MESPTISSISSLFFLLLITVQVNAIEWARYQFPPVHILTGQDAGEGIGDKIFLALKEQLPNIEHQEFRAPIKRIIGEMRAKRDVCALFHHSTEREPDMVFSSPIVWVTAHHIYIKTQNLAAWKEKTSWYGGALKMENLLAHNPNLKLGIVAGRSYGRVVDSLIAKQVNQTFLHSGSAPTERLVKMLLASRVDYILEYPWLMNYQLKKSNIQQKLISIPVAENTKLLSAHIACTKSPQGIDTVNRINELILTHAKLYSSFMEEWLTSKQVEEYRKQL